jgi:hypothetical protein
MKKSLIALAVSALCYGTNRSRTLDVAITYRMGAGFPGDVNRMHPASIVPNLMDAANPIRLYGDPCTLGAANSVRGFLAGDAALTRIRGVLVRPAVAQPTSGGMTQTFGTGAVFVWVTASAGADVQGGFRAAASAGNTAAILNAEWYSPPDSGGIAELRVWRQG